MLNQFKQMAIFAKVVEKESFTAAADALGMTKSMISQHVSDLEKKLGVRLLNRTTRKLTLTEEGAIYFEGCSRMIQEAEIATNRMCHLQRKPSGLLRITAPHGAVSTLVPLIADFMRLNPLVKIDLNLEEAQLDLVEHQIDVALRYGWPQDSSMLAVMLGRFRQIVCASPAYLEEHSAPQVPKDLVKHQWVIYNQYQSPCRWTFHHHSGQQETIHIQGAVTTNTSEGMKFFVLEGKGMGVLVDIDANQYLEEGRLIQVLPDYQLPEGAVYAMFPSNEQQPLKVRAFIDFLKKEWLAS